jgi:tRNA pseudouridine38-40 synthase
LEAGLALPNEEELSAGRMSPGGQVEEVALRVERSEVAASRGERSEAAALRVERPSLASRGERSAAAALRVERPSLASRGERSEAAALRVERPSLAMRAEEAVSPCTLALEVSYLGAPFAGFARQPGQLTVQGELEQALSLLFRRPVEVVCSGRTDAGVHARGQVVSFGCAEEELRGRTLSSMRRSLNALTHDAIVVRAIHWAPRGFSARFDAQWRTYKYFLATGEVPPLLTAQSSWYAGSSLALDAMREAAAFLVGEHDFKSFCIAASAVGKSTTREVMNITFNEEDIMGEPHVLMTITGNAFLHSMVRTIVGTLVLVGKGKREPEWVADVLAARSREAAGENAPAAGLVFWCVGYEEGLFSENPF